MNTTSVISFFWTAFCALAMCLQTKALSGLPLEFGALEGFVFAGTIAGYNVISRIHWRSVGGALAFLPAAWFWWQLPLSIQLASVGAALFWGIYQGLPGRWGLRDWLLLKPIAVAAAWASVCVLLPFPPWPVWAIAIVFLEKGMFVFALAICYDLIDRAPDKQLGFRTLASTLGTKKSLVLFYFSLFLSGLLATIALLTETYSPEAFLAIVFVLFLSAWLPPWQLRRFGAKQWQKLTVDALMFLQSLLVLLCSVYL